MQRDINDRREVHIDAERLKLTSCCQRYLVGNLVGADGSKGHIAREDGCGFPKSLHKSVFLVNGNE